MDITVQDARGFTLLEVLVAIAIGAAVAIMAYQGLSVAATVAERHTEQAQALSDLQLAMSVVDRDLRQLVSRPIVDESESDRPAVLCDPLGDSVVEFTKGGWRNPLNLPRGSIQRVRYILEEGMLWRESWSVLDRQSNSHKQRVRLFGGVQNVQLRFLDAENLISGQSVDQQWRDRWPAAQPDQEKKMSTIPSAVEWMIELKDWGLIRRVYWLPG
ncbi:type II secretion system protein GspJ [Motiliproteus coralliicola]|uniref:Type II secretion system protein J n=1 Tax=Motiliproteus coralliicola TaxID=2283196 RepID=A0A369WL68_9GAMM|nr:type II secretion system minor pseudopilin GspJ [Motiliproteus coralliicola]RDE22367.1 type II secretion system protein GspJ [Motiliproteus coralliicola]